MADGSVVKAGGKVVKNVAGYDLCKLFCGSRGTLGLLNTGVGTASLVLGVARLIGKTEAQSHTRVRLAPWFAARTATGLAARVEF